MFFMLPVPSPATKKVHLRHPLYIHHALQLANPPQNLSGISAMEAKIKDRCTRGNENPIIAAAAAPPCAHASSLRENAT